MDKKKYMATRVKPQSHPDRKKYIIETARDPTEYPIHIMSENGFFLKEEKLGRKKRKKEKGIN